VDGNGDLTDGGSIEVSGASVATWNARGDQAGSGGTITIDAFGDNGTGTITTTAGAESFNTIGGSGGGSGGNIDLTATGSIALAGDMDTAGQGELSSPGWITIAGGTASTHTVTVQSTSRIEADGSGADASNGAIDISGCNIVVEGAIDTRNTSLDGGGGTNSFVYDGNMSSTVGSSILADDVADFGANSVTCRCVDTSPADGTCDTPLTCASPPSLLGTVTPAIDITYLPSPGCD
jgi:hypothetical protein